MEEADVGDDRISVELHNFICASDEDDAIHRVQDIAIDPQAEDGLILEEAAAMQQNGAATKTKVSQIQSINNTLKFFFSEPASSTGPIS